MAMPCFIHGRKQICKSASHGSDLSWASSLTSAETLSSCLVSFAVFWRAGKWEKGNFMIKSLLWPKNGTTAGGIARGKHFLRHEGN